MEKSAKKSPKKKPCKQSKRTKAAQPSKKQVEEYVQPKPLTKEQKAKIERIMSLPHMMRWKAGAKDWDFIEQAYAKSIERKRMAEDMYYRSAIFEW